MRAREDVSFTKFPPKMYIQNAALLFIAKYDKHLGVRNSARACPKSSSHDSPQRNLLETAHGSRMRPLKVAGGFSAFKYFVLRVQDDQRRVEAEMSDVRRSNESIKIWTPENDYFSKSFSDGVVSPLVYTKSCVVKAFSWRFFTNVLKSAKTAPRMAK